MKTDEYIKNKYLIDQSNPIHFIKTILIKNEVININKSKKINKIGDLGCGFGIISKELSKISMVDAFDIDQKKIYFAKKMHKSKLISFFVEDIRNIDKRDYDLIVCSEVLQYFLDDSDILEKINKMLRPNGHLLLTVPINKNLITDFDRREKSKRYTVKEIIMALENSGFEIKTKRYWGFPLLKFFYLFIYVPKSNQEANNKTKNYRFSRLSLFLLKCLRYIFLIDIFFNKNNSFNILIVAKKKK